MQKPYLGDSLALVDHSEFYPGGGFLYIIVIKKFQT